MGYRILLVALVATSLNFYSNTAEAQSQPSQDRGSDKLDLKKLEDKYWSAKDTDLNVVQNRTYKKDGRMFVSLSYGPLVNDAWSFGRMTNAAVGYYFNERWGVEVAHEMGSLKNNDSVGAIKDLGGTPDYNTFDNYTSLNAIVVPFYAKMSFMDRKIMYFDMQFAVGVGQMNYTSKVDASDGGDIEDKAIGYNVDVTQQLFFHENFALRLDIKNKFTKQKKYKGNMPGNNATATPMSDMSQQDTSILLGLTVFF